MELGVEKTSLVKVCKTCCYSLTIGSSTITADIIKLWTEYEQKSSNLFRYQDLETRKD